MASKLRIEVNEIMAVTMDYLLAMLHYLINGSAVILLYLHNPAMTGLSFTISYTQKLSLSLFITVYLSI